MTVCIGVVDQTERVVYVGADSGVSCSSFYTSTVTPKVFHPNRFDVVIGCAGSIRLANLLYSDGSLFDGISEDNDDLIKALISTFIPKLKAHAETLKSDDVFDLILGFKDRLFRVQSDFGIYESSTGLETIGSACEVAYGAMTAMNEIDRRGSSPDKILKAISICSSYNYGIETRGYVIRSTRTE